MKPEDWPVLDYFMEKEPSTAAISSRQKPLPVILDEVERDARWRYSSPEAAADIADYVPALVKALRRAVEQLTDVSAATGYGPGDMDINASHKLDSADALAEITAILTNAGKGKAKKDLE